MLKPYYMRDGIEVGIDEVGRGSLVGPVVSAAVIVPKDFFHKKIRDSKKIPKQEHKNLSLDIKKNAISWAIAEASKEEIEKHNILNATFMAMHRAVAKIIDKQSHPPTRLLVDGNMFKPYLSISHVCIVNGDDNYYSIATASIIAKHFRDKHLKTLHAKYPMYGWDTNAGYATEKHKKAIAKYGLTPYHRKTFKPCSNF